MKTRITAIGRCVFLLVVSVIINTAAGQQQRTNSPITTEWPRAFVRNGVTNIIYQPQLDSWDHLTIKGRSAVSVQPAGAKQPIYGTIEIVAETQVDKVERLVYFDKFQITKAQFPSAPESEAKYLETLRSLLPKEIKTMSLDRVEASLAVLEQKRKGQGEPIRNDPPQFIFTKQPAMLIQVEGEPLYRPVEGTDLERVMNTRTLLLRDNTGKHYLHFFDGYLEATNLTGPWRTAIYLPKGVTEAEKKAVESRDVDLLAGQENPKTKAMPSLKSTRIPQLFVVTGPAELIVTRGEPQWAPIPGTKLLFVTNSASHVFKNMADQKTYILVSGRWFSASSLSGPWEHVAGTKLPQDFAAIPDDSEKENVKAAVPNTRQAEEAAIANEIPQTTKVSRKEQKLDPLPAYDGQPQMQEIKGTQLQFAINSATPVIKAVDGGWYACQNAVWFVASGPGGPWSVADSVPPEIYSIPPDSPVHYVTYVRIYNSDAEYVWVGATPGYYGTVVDPEGVVVYGTGYNYPVYVGSTVYVSYPVTYGYASNPIWTPWVGWAFGFAAGWALADEWDEWGFWGYCPPAPYWGAYRYGCYGRHYNPYGGITAWGPYGWAGTSGYVYHQAGNRAGVSRTAAGFNAWTGNEWARQYGRSYNSVTGVRTAGTRGSVNNIYTGRYAEGGRGVAVHEPSGAVAAGRRGTVGGPGGEVSGGRGVAYNPQTGQGTAVRGVRGDEGGMAKINGEFVAAKDGNVYRGNGSGGWDNVSVTPHSRTSAARSNVSSQTTRSYNNQVAARNTGAQRQASFQSHQPSFSGGAAARGGGGGFRGGGGGGRRR